MIYIKKLTKSDLTIINRFWRPKLKQEAIVLSRRYIESLGDEYLDMNRRDPVPMQMVFFGPEGKPAIVKADASIGRMTHDWRIQGCSLNDPTGDTERFALLQPGDLFMFSLVINDENRIGRGLFVARHGQQDSELFEELKPFTGKVTASEEIMAVLRDHSLDPAHPAYTVLAATGQIDIEWTEAPPQTESELIDSLQAGAVGLSGRQTRLGREDLQAALEESERIGGEGELKFNRWLLSRPVIDGKHVINHTWISDTHATAPYDFELNFDDGSQAFLELKSTTGPFNNRLYISSGELAVMASEGIYVILARLFNLDDGAKIRFAFDVRERAKEVLDSVNFGGLDAGLVSIWADPELFDFNQEDIELI